MHNRLTRRYGITKVVRGQTNFKSRLTYRKRVKKSRMTFHCPVEYVGCNEDINVMRNNVFVNFKLEYCIHVVLLKVITSYKNFKLSSIRIDHIF